MQTSEHKDKASRILATMRKLDDEADAEALIEAAMHVSTHLLNAILHDRGIKSPEDDMLHTTMPAPLAVVPVDLAQPIDELEWLENLRAFYVRGSMDVPEGTIKRARDICDLFAKLAG